MSQKRIVITGMGVVSCLGQDVDQFYQNLLQGKSGATTIDSFDTSDFPVKIAAEIKDFSAEGYVDKKQARRLDKYSTYLLVAGKKAMIDAGLDDQILSKLNKYRIGVIIGSGMGGMQVFSDGVQALIEKGPKRVSPFFVPYIISSMGGALLAMDYGFMGPNYSISTACATANNSIISAANHIRMGDADMMICGGADASINPIGVAGFAACKALSKRNDEPEKASRPWDVDRDGFLIGEGSGVIILESLEHAINRGAPIIAEYLGSGMNCDAYHMTEPRKDGKGVAICVNLALKDANISPDDVNYINAHATSTPSGDMAEVNALKQVFSNPAKILMNSTKSMLGHCLGAAGGVEAVATIKAITDDIIHPTINLDNPEEGLAFDVPKVAKKSKINIAISNSFGFGGHNATVVFGKYNP